MYILCRLVSTCLEPRVLSLDPTIGTCQACGHNVKLLTLPSVEKRCRTAEWASCLSLRKQLSNASCEYLAALQQWARPCVMPAHVQSIILARRIRARTKRCTLPPLVNHVRVLLEELLSFAVDLSCDFYGNWVLQAMITDGPQYYQTRLCCALRLARHMVRAPCTHATAICLRAFFNLVSFFTSSTRQQSSTERSPSGH